MPTLTIRNVPTEVRDRLRVRAASHGRSMEAEVRDLLSLAVTPEEKHRSVELQREKIEAARRVLRKYVPEGRSLVEEFLAERRGSWGESD